MNERISERERCEWTDDGDEMNPVEKVADQALISKWRKPGYENLCSLLSVQKGDTNFGTASICRVPIASR